MKLHLLRRRTESTISSKNNDSSNILSNRRFLKRTSTAPTPTTAGEMSSIASTVVSLDDDEDDLDSRSSLRNSGSSSRALAAISPLSEDPSERPFGSPRNRRRRRRPESLPDALGMWWETASGLVLSEPVAELVESTSHVALCTGQLVLAPLAWPGQVCHRTVQLLGDTIVRIHPLALLTNDDDDDDSGGERQASTAADETNNDDNEQQQQQRHPNPVVHAAQQVWGFPGFCLGVAGHLTHEVGATVLHLVAPVFHNNGGGANTTATTTIEKEQDEDEDDYLERLRLDFGQSSKSQASSNNSKSPSKVKQSLFLLRVNDLGMCHKKAATSVQGKEGLAVTYIDLELTESKLVQTALDRLVRAGLSLVANHPPTSLVHLYKTTPLAEINWKMEGQTSKLLRKMTKLSTLDRLHFLQRETLIWSGRYKMDDQVHTRKSTFYLARGVVLRNPLDFLQLMWDNSRTNEYNNHSMGRETLSTIHADDQGVTSQQTFRQSTKIIRSETRVPFAGFSVGVNCLMHVRPLAAPDQGYVVVSRSLEPGPAGVHLETDDTSPHMKNNVNNNNNSSKSNEIQWGVNIMRAVPNHPDITDLTSLSQVSSSLVPKFLSGKIAMMGIQEFFDQVRNESKLHQSSSTPTPQQ